MRRVIWWLRRDLRLTDNQALMQAHQSGDEVLPVFIIDSKLLASPYQSEKRLAFLYGGLRVLQASLRQRGGQMVIRQGDPVEALKRLMEESGAQAIFAEADVTPYARQRDARIADLLPVNWAGNPAVLPPGAVMKPDGSPYTTFTPFSKAWKAACSIRAAQRFDEAPLRLCAAGDLESAPIPDEPQLPAGAEFIPGEAEAQRRLFEFTQGTGELAPVYSYAWARNRHDLDGTARISAYLRFGMLSARQAVAAAMQAIQSAPDEQARNSAETWLNELIWREFYIHILYHYPHVRQRNFRQQHVRWQNNPADLAAWQSGRTGYPVVDAAMRQLVQTGWMHNRPRMIVASFLTKHLLVDWRWGERFFMQHLIDGDPAANNGGWQWTAGTGTDAAPYFRIFNPVSQSMKHDPDGVYIRRWVPELRRMPNEYIHAPWEAPEEVQRSAACRVGVDYPAPIVDHAMARQRALKAYGQKNSPSG